MSSETQKTIWPVPQPRPGDDFVLGPPELGGPDDGEAARRPPSFFFQKLFAVVLAVGMCGLLVSPHLPSWITDYWVVPEEPLIDESDGGDPKPPEGDDLGLEPIVPPQPPPKPPKWFLQKIEALLLAGEHKQALIEIKDFWSKHPNVRRKYKEESFALMKLEKAALQGYSQPRQLTAPPQALTRATALQDIAVLDHQLMEAAIVLEQETSSLEHFTSAELGYSAAIGLMTTSTPDGPSGNSTRQELQSTYRNLGKLYLSWAKHKQDTSFLPKALEAIRESQKLVRYADDPDAASRALAELKTKAEGLRAELLSK